MLNDVYTKQQEYYHFVLCMWVLYEGVCVCGAEREGENESLYIHSCDCDEPYMSVSFRKGAVLGLHVHSNWIISLVPGNRHILGKNCNKNFVLFLQATNQKQKAFALSSHCLWKRRWCWFVVPVCLWSLCAWLPPCVTASAGHWGADCCMFVCFHFMDVLMS